MLINPEKHNLRPSANNPEFIPGLRQEAKALAYEEIKNSLKDKA